MMKLPRPDDKLADCVWLPRILAKARALKAGRLAPEYAVRYGAPNGVDGQFLEFFKLTKEDVLTAADLSDAAVCGWFRALPTATAERVEEWNETAVNFGRPGFPMEERLAIALATTYSHLANDRFETVFEVLIADEQS